MELSRRGMLAGVGAACAVGTVGFAGAAAMSDGEFNGERLIVTKVELGLVAAIALIVAVWLLLGVDALVVLGVVLALGMLVVVTLLARGGPTTIDGG